MQGIYKREKIKYASKITKIGKDHYSFTSEHVEIDNLVQAANKPEERWITLTTSSQLRHCEPLKCIIKTLKKMDDTITSFPNALSRVLSKYLPKQKEKMKETFIKQFSKTGESDFYIERICFYDRDLA